MRRAAVGAIILSMWLLACQPVEVTVEVTRLVETEVTVMAPVPTAEVITIAETRLVPQDVTRVVSEEVLVEVTRPPLGTTARPVQLLFPPFFNSTIIETRTAALVAELEAATGLRFAVGILDNPQTLLDLMCDAPGDSIGFLPAFGYVMARDRCAVQLGLVAEESDGLTWDTGMIVARRDSGIQELSDLADKSWAVPDTDSIPQFLFFQALLADQGIAPGEIVEVPGDNSAMLAVYESDVDFATATYIPPVLPFEERTWEYGTDSPELWRVLGIPPTRSPIGYVLVLAEPEFGGYRLRDARSGIFDAEPGIYDETRIIALSGQIPNEVIVFGAEFPLGLSRVVSERLTAFASSEQCGPSLCAGDFYGWTGLEKAEDQEFNALGFVIDTLELTDEELWALARP